MRLALVCACVVMMQTSTKEIVSVGPPPVGPYSPAVKAGGLVYLSGTLAQDTSGAVVGKGDVGAQTRRVIEQLRDILVASGSSLERVVSVTVYLESPADFQAMNDAYRQFWPNDAPTRTTVISDLVLPDALVEMSMIAVPIGAERQVIHPKGWMTSPSPYSYAIRTGGTVFLSGLVSRNGRDNSVVAGNISEQTRTVLDNARELLEAAGLSFGHVVSARVYLTDVANFQAMNDVYRQYFPAPAPARATVGARLAGNQYLVEVTLVASSAPRSAHGDAPAGIPISAAIRAGDKLYLSGVLGNTDDTKGNPGAQTRETLARLQKTLQSAGASPAHVLDVLVYLRDLKDFAAMNDEYRAFFGRDFPARATVAATLVPDDGLVEIMMTAAAR